MIGVGRTPELRLHSNSLTRNGISSVFRDGNRRCHVTSVPRSLLTIANNDFTATRFRFFPLSRNDRKRSLGVFRVLDGVLGGTKRVLAFSGGVLLFRSTEAERKNAATRARRNARGYTSASARGGWNISSPPINPTAQLKIDVVVSEVHGAGG